MYLNINGCHCMTTIHACKVCPGLSFLRFEFWASPIHTCIHYVWNLQLSAGWWDTWRATPSKRPSVYIKLASPTKDLHSTVSMSTWMYVCVDVLRVCTSVSACACFVLIRVLPPIIGPVAGQEGPWEGGGLEAFVPCECHPYFRKRACRQLF